MTEALALAGGERVLEIGTGSGYQGRRAGPRSPGTCTPSKFWASRHPSEALSEKPRVPDLHVRCGERAPGGWPERAPFDRIVLTARRSTSRLPLIDQLKEGEARRPVGDVWQELSW